MENNRISDGGNELPYHMLRAEEEYSDDSKLNKLGYKQELSRTLSALANFSVTFSIISVITGITTLYNQGLSFGGPVTMVYGWPIVGLMTLFVGLSLAEICSAYPTSGGLYFWSAKLCGRDWGPFSSWITGCIGLYDPRILPIPSWFVVDFKHLKDYAYVKFYYAKYTRVKCYTLIHTRNANIFGHINSHLDCRCS